MFVWVWLEFCIRPFFSVLAHLTSLPKSFRSIELFISLQSKLCVSNLKVAVHFSSCMKKISSKSASRDILKVSAQLLLC